MSLLKNLFSAAGAVVVLSALMPTADAADLRERCWMWGHDTGAFDGPNNKYNIPLSDPVPMADAALGFGVRNVCVVRWSTPGSDPAYLRQFRALPRIGWLIASGYSKPEKNCALTEGALAMMDRLPNLTTLEVDDFFRLDLPTGLVEIAGEKVPVAHAAYTIGELRALRRRIAESGRRFALPPELRLVLYAKDLDGPIRPYFDCFDSVTLWTWDGDDLAALERNFRRYREMAPDKPTYLGIYMWDFGGCKPISMDFMRHQLDVGLDLFRKGEVEGLIFHCTPLVNKNLEAVEFAKRWLKEHAHEKFASLGRGPVRRPAVADVRAFGAKETNAPAANARAVQAAIDDVARQGGGRVTVPAGTWRSGTVWLKDGVELHLDAGAVLKASEDLADYNAEDAFPGNRGAPNEGWNGGHLVIAHKCRNVAITGPGTINGSGESFFAGAQAPVADAYSYKDWRKAKGPERPGRMLVFWECRGVRIENVTLRDSPSWACFVMGCDDVVIRDYRVRNGPLNECTDGLDIDCSRNVLVERADIDAGDDAIAIRAGVGELGFDKPCENVVVRDSVLGSTATDFRVGVGAGTIRNVTVENVVCLRGGTSVLFNGFWGDPAKGGVDIEDVVFRNVDFGAKWGPSFLSGGDCQKFGFRNIRFDNCRFASGRGAVEDKGRFKTENLVFENCAFAR